MVSRIDVECRDCIFFALLITTAFREHKYNLSMFFLGPKQFLSLIIASLVKDVFIKKNKKLHFRHLEHQLTISVYDLLVLFTYQLACSM